MHPRRAHWKHTPNKKSTITHNRQIDKSSRRSGTSRCDRRGTAVKDGRSGPGHNERNLKLISSPSLPTPPTLPPSLPPLCLQRGASTSPRSPRTSRWCWESGWCCPAWSSTTAASSSGPRTAWPSAWERVSEVRDGGGEGKEGNNSAHGFGSAVAVRAATKAAAAEKRSS